MFILYKILPLMYLYARPFIKWFLHKFTRLCELQRICYGARAGANRTRQVERSLSLSKCESIQRMIKDFDEIVEFCNDEEFKQIIPQSVTIVCRAKRIKLRSHPDFPSLFGQCVLHIWSYKRLLFAVERLRSEQFDSDNIQHEKKLLDLWNYLMPEEFLESRITKQWQQIGFQGDDPKTDFRGMGMLGLENLLYFAKEYRGAAQHVLLHSKHPRFGYTFAIVGINLTSMALRMLKSGTAKTHFYNVAAAGRTECSMDHFHKFYSYLLFEFDRFWMESEPKNIMDFQEIYKNFQKAILTALENDNTRFKTNLVVENV